jgi:hypothetical protein
MGWFALDMLSPEKSMFLVYPELGFLATSILKQGSRRAADEPPISSHRDFSANIERSLAHLAQASAQAPELTRRARLQTCPWHTHGPSEGVMQLSET